MKTKPKVGSMVSIRRGTYEDDPWVDATVEAQLSVQFTCVAERRRADGGTVEMVLFGFYADEGVTWKKI